MTEKPKRIQRKRAKGWRMPENTVYVGRGSRWGNPFRVGDFAPDYPSYDGPATFVMDADECVRRYAEQITPYRHHGPTSGLEQFYLSVAKIEDIQLSLRGKNLACWCPLVCTQCNGSRFGAKNICHRIYTPGNIKDGGASVVETVSDRCPQCQGTGRQPCHADVLLELANRIEL